MCIFSWKLYSKFCHDYDNVLNGELTRMQALPSWPVATINAVRSPFALISDLPVMYKSQTKLRSSHARLLMFCCLREFNTTNK